MFGIDRDSQLRVPKTSYAMLPGVTCELSGLDRKMSARVRAQTRTMSEMYPSVGKLLVKLHTKNGERCMSMLTGRIDDPDVWDNNTMAVCTLNQAEGRLNYFYIGVNPAYFKNELTAAMQYKWIDFNGSQPKGTASPEGSVVHEFGHGAHVYLRGCVRRLDEELYDIAMHEFEEGNHLCGNLGDPSMNAHAVSDDPRRREYYIREVFANGFAAAHLGAPEAQNHPITRYIQKAIDGIRED